MSQITDRQTLITEFEAYIKRSFTIDRQDTFIQLSELRIQRDLRPQENVVKTTIVPTSNLVDLPADFIDVRELSAKNGRRVVVLSSVGRHKLAVATSITGFPVVYSIIGDQFEVGSMLKSMVEKHEIEAVAEQICIVFDVVETLSLDNAEY